MRFLIMRYRFLFLLFISSMIFANNMFSIEEINDIESAITFNIGGYTFQEYDGYHRIESNTKGKIENLGEPELPTYTFNYAIEREKKYTINYNILSFDIIEDINLYPVQHPIENNTFNKKDNLYNSVSSYPHENLTSKIMSLRGNELLAIELVPFEYNFNTKKLKIYTSVEIIISESGYRNNSSNIPRSKVFENLYSNFVINEPIYQNNRSFQKPSILYIMEDYISSIELLVDWRRKNGYVVTVIDNDDITGSFTSNNIKDYIENAYDNWAYPPEYVCLVGDANGSLAIPTFTVGGGGGWSGAYAEGDFPYVLLDGDDFLPDIFIGRMSVRSTSELSIVINKIIGYEKNYSNDSDWLSTAALVGDPYSSSGISTVITNQYIEQIMNIHGGITDVRTKFSGSNFDGWMRDQINDGVSFLNYRGIYGFSGFTSTEVNQLNNDSMLTARVKLLLSH